MNNTQNYFVQEMEKEIGKVIMRWDNELREWYEIAMKALNHASVSDLNVVQKRYPELFVTDYHGVNMQVVATLCNNLERVRPAELGYTALQWVDVIKLNVRVANRWENLVDPIRATVRKRVQLTLGKKNNIIHPVGEA